MNVLVTSGGTIEKIDSVRNITNTSTGILGSLIATRFAAGPCVKKIFYVCGNSLVNPQNDKTEIIRVESVFSLENVIRELLSLTKIEVIVHAMAVSDYYIKSVLSSGIPVCTEGKINSDMENLTLILEHAPKIISLFQVLSPQSTLIGFKLMDNVQHENLIDHGFQLLTKNKCSFVLANDLRDISNEKHIGYLIDRKKNYVRCSSKLEIANAIVSAVMSERTKT